MVEQLSTLLGEGGDNSDLAERALGEVLVPKMSALQSAQQQALKGAQVALLEQAWKARAVVVFANYKCTG